jgi:UDP-N-acetylmuramoyl-L-alanyl-D-glutamate--2,6-diaminopimelate ligase
MQIKNISNLFASIPVKTSGKIPDTAVRGITQDSRDVKSGYLFVAVEGEVTDGHLFISNAIQNGASAVVGSRRIEVLEIPYIQVEDSRLALALLSAAFYDFPARSLLMVGVTGTDGKTTTANVIFNILEAAGLPVGMVSTVNAVIGEKNLDTGFHVTTPDAVHIQYYLSKMRDAGLTHVILEATSHGLAQQRVTACDFDIGVVTNIAHEHLDFHGTFEAYRGAKSKLFSGLDTSHWKDFDPPRGAVLNRDDPSFEYLSKITKVPQISYGVGGGAEVSAVNVSESSGGISFIAKGKSLEGEEFSIPLFTPLLGFYNVSNVLAATAATRGILELKDAAVQNGIMKLKFIPGRMEKIEMGQNFLAIVDFAHTPNALKNALEAGSRLVEGKVIAIFGSAGLRDKKKRRMMAQISAEFADLTILTAEDPRTESLDEILDEMAQGLAATGGVEGNTFWRIADRGWAIRFGLKLAHPGDLVIACGKGHEQSMCFGEIEYPWDDRTAMRAALAEYLQIEGPDMPFLPTQE